MAGEARAHRVRLTALHEHIRRRRSQRCSVALRICEPTNSSMNFDVTVPYGTTIFNAYRVLGVPLTPAPSFAVQPHPVFGIYLIEDSTFTHRSGLRGGAPEAECDDETVIRALTTYIGKQPALEFDPSATRTANKKSMKAWLKLQTVGDTPTATLKQIDAAVTRIVKVLSTEAGTSCAACGDMLEHTPVFCECKISDRSFDATLCCFECVETLATVANVVRRCVCISLSL